ncbi:MAG: hypothetical protein ACI9TH_001364 [Kiritimatiellia bacterium]|jgi:hypothetical protein
MKHLIWCLLLGLVPPGMAGEWMPLFNGKDLEGWHSVRVDEFVHGKATVEDGVIMLHAGQPGSGLRLADPAFPVMNYEVELKAQRIEGFDFFCGLNVPVSNAWITLIVGGWDGDVLGLSNLDGMSAIENAYVQHVPFKQKTWYTIRMRVEPKRITVWLNDQKKIEAKTKGVRIGARDTMRGMKPMGVCSWFTTAGLKDLRVRTL